MTKAVKYTHASDKKIKPPSSLSPAGQQMFELIMSFVIIELEIFIFYFFIKR